MNKSNTMRVMIKKTIEKNTCVNISTPPFQDLFGKRF